jgi:hypothetical protein
MIAAPRSAAPATSPQPSSASIPHCRAVVAIKHAAASEATSIIAR